MKIAIVKGGPSTEAEVSRVSAAAVEKALLSRGHQVAALELDAGLPGALLSYRPEVVFPVVHGALGEDGCLQGLLEILEFPYVGSQVQASALCADKDQTKLVLGAHGLPLAKSLVLTATEIQEQPAVALLKRARQELGDSLFVKPVVGGSTIGISRVASEQDWEPAIKLAASLSERVLVETFHKGEELTCGVLELGGKLIGLPPTLIRSQKADFYDFQSKYAASGSLHLCPAPLPAATLQAIQEAAVRAHRATLCRDLSRTDFILAEDGSFIVLEVNTLPGMTGVSLYPEQAAHAGYEFPVLLEALAAQALARFVPRQDQSAPMPVAGGAS